MTTVRQVLTNSMNAGESTGPRTETGKRMSADNARVHGLRARQGLLPWEAESEFETMREQLWQELAPEGVREEMLVERILRMHWQLEQRLPLFEVGVISRHLVTSVEDAADSEQQFGVRQLPISTECDDCEIDTLGLQQLHATRLGAALITGLSPKSSDVLVYLDRYRRSLERSLTESLDRLQRYQQEREKSEIEEEWSEEWKNVRSKQ